MTDSVERLYEGVIKARHGDPTRSRTRAAACASAAESSRSSTAPPWRDWTIPYLTANQAPHAQTPVRLVHRSRPQALCRLDHGRRFVCRKLGVSDPARHHADSDVA